MNAPADLPYILRELVHIAPQGRGALTSRASHLADLIESDAQAAKPDPSHALLLQLAHSQMLNLKALALMARALKLQRGYFDATSSQEVRNSLTEWQRDLDRWVTDAEVQP